MVRNRVPVVSPPSNLVIEPTGSVQDDASSQSYCESTGQSNEGGPTIPERRSLLAVVRGASAEESSKPLSPTVRPFASSGE